MFIQVKKLCGRFFAQVRNSYADGFGILFETPEYLTEAMALADARCWRAFHGGEKSMTKPEEVTKTTTTGDMPEDVVTIPTTAGHVVELEVADVREIFRRIELYRGALRGHEQGSAKRQRREITSMVEEFGLTFEEARDLADWYGDNIYDPKKWWTCPL